MALTHKITRCVGSHTEHREEWSSSSYLFHFYYVPGSGYTDPYVAHLGYGDDYYLSDSPVSGDKNLSEAYYLEAGTYKVELVEHHEDFSLWKANIYEDGNKIVQVGTFYDGDRIVLEQDAYYLIMENDPGVYLTKLIREYDEEVLDYATTVIDEPIGFDDLQSTIKRQDYHGMGAEVSLGTLEFYGAAADIIEDKYASDIDSDVLYEVVSGEETIYSGQIDLSTISIKQGDYRSVSVKVGEIGAKTVFNNRTDKDVDIDNPVTIDGAAIDKPTWLSLQIPLKHLLYTNIVKQKTDVIYSTISGGATPYNVPVAETIDRYIHVPLNGDPIVEFTDFRDEEGSVETSSTDNIEPQYVSSEDHSQKYGSNTVANVSSYLDIDVKVLDYGSGITNERMWFVLAAKDVNGNTIEGERRGVYIRTAGNWSNVKCKLSGQLTATNSIKYYIRVYADARATFVFKIKKGSYRKMTMYDNLQDTNVKANMILVHDALNIVSHAISENALVVKSDWYRTPDSHWDAGAIRTDANGGSGALKALTNGYKIRGLFSDEDNERNMPISFKKLIESLSAIDCIGWGFSKENGSLCVRVERWDWFYKDNVVLTLDKVNELQIDVDADHIPVEFKIGYKKFATQDQYNSIDSPHGTRTFINGIKALNKSSKAESEIIADNYAIEETRRARTQVSETEETTYDENIFVFELLRKKSDGAYSVGHTALNAVNVGNANEFINAKLTPRHMAARWRDYIFATNNTTPFRFTTGEINYKSSFMTHSSEPTIDNVEYNSLTSMAVANPQAENDDITNTHAKFNAEKIKFSYPLSVSQYHTICDNPYGLIRLTNGNAIVAEGWLLDFKYKFEDGMADFTLLVKHSNN